MACSTKISFCDKIKTKDYKEKLVARANDYHLHNISFWPMQPSNLAPIIYSAADVNIIPLVKDVFRTALPSKTATCLACQKPIIFAIGQNSQFGNRMRKEAGCTVVESDLAEELAQAIQRVQKQSQSGKQGHFFKENMNRLKNSRQYATIISRKKE